MTIQVKKWRKYFFLHLFDEAGVSCIPIALTESEAMALSQKFNLTIEEIKPVTTDEILNKIIL